MITPERFPTEFEKISTRLGDILRAHRRRATLTGEELAKLIDISQSKISKIEAGDLRPTDRDLQGFIKALKISNEDAYEIRKLQRLLHREFNTWRVLHREGLQEKQRDIEEIERKASIISLFQPALIPGLLQTPEYAREVLKIADITGAGDVEAAVAARVKRQRILRSSKRQLCFLISEAAIRWRFCQSSVLVKQLIHLRNLIQKINIGIIPLNTRVAALPLTAFCVFDKSVAFIETDAGELLIWDTLDIEQFLKTFDELMKVAVYGRQAAILLGKIGSELAIED